MERVCGGKGDVPSAECIVVTLFVTTPDLELYITDFENFFFKRCAIKFYEGTFLFLKDAQ